MLFFVKMVFPKGTHIRISLIVTLAVEAFEHIVKFRAPLVGNLIETTGSI